MSSPSPWRKRAPLLVFVAAGLWLWKSPLLPQERSLIWELPRGELPRRAEVQLWDGDTLFKREERSFEPGYGAGGDWVQKVQLKGGSYRVETFVYRADGGLPEHGSQVILLGREETVRRPLLVR